MCVKNVDQAEGEVGFVGLNSIRRRGGGCEVEFIQLIVTQQQTSGFDCNDLVVVV